LARAEEGLRCAGVRAEVLLGEPRRLHAGECGRARAIDTSSSAEASIARRHARRDGSCMPVGKPFRNRHAPSAEETCRQPCSFALLRSIRSNDRLGESAVAAFLRRHTSRRRRARRRSRVCGASPSRLVRGRARGTRVWWARGEASNRDWIGLSRLPRARSCRNSNNRASGTRGTPCRRGSPRSSPRRRAGT
jgi:hypothetical protein